MRSLVFILTLFLFISCEETENCDLNYYPSPPYSSPDDTLYGENQVRYLYVCWNDSGYNRIFTYIVSGDCWEMYSEDEYNSNCN